MPILRETLIACLLALALPANAELVLRYGPAHPTIKKVTASSATFQGGDVAISCPGWETAGIKATTSASSGVAYPGRKCGFIDDRGRVIIEPKFHMVYAFSEGYAAVQVDDGGEWGYIDTHGDWLFEPQFRVANPFDHGIGTVQLSTDWEGDTGACITTAGQIFQRSKRKRAINRDIDDECELARIRRGKPDRDGLLVKSKTPP
jgi:hypothetical protein